MGPKYNSLNDLINDLDHESIDDDNDLLGDEDLAMIQFPKVAAPASPEKPKRKSRKKS